MNKQNQKTGKIILFILISLVLIPFSADAQNASGQFRLLVNPFEVQDVQKKDVAKFDDELKRLLQESGRYELITEEELKESKRALGLNVRNPVPDSMIITVSKDLGARIALMGKLQTTEGGTIRTDAKMIEVLSEAEKKIGYMEISVGTDITVLAGTLANRLFQRADIDKYLTFGKDYIRSNIFDRAIENFDRVIALDSTVTEAHYYLGNAYLQMQDTTNAVASYERAIRIDDEYGAAMQRLASITLKRGDYEQAIDLYSRLVEIEPENANHFLYLGVAYYSAERLEDALSSYQKGHELNPNEPHFCEYCGRIYYQMERYADAAKYFEDAAKLQPENIEVLQLLAASYNQLENFEKATEAYEKLVAMDPHFPNGYKYLGTWYGKIKQYDKAIRALEQGLQNSPESEHPDIYLALVDVYLKAGRFYKVIEVGNRALKVTANKRIYVFLGDAYQSIGESLEKENTSESYSKAIDNYEASTTNYNKVVGDAKYGKYAQQSIQRNKDLIERAELIIKKLRLEEG
jgi:tetratricopeptide (TPR) repeat protein